MNDSGRPFDFFGSHYHALLPIFSIQYSGGVNAVRAPITRCLIAPSPLPLCSVVPLSSIATNALPAHNDLLLSTSVPNVHDSTSTSVPAASTAAASLPKIRNKIPVRKALSSAATKIRDDRDDKFAVAAAEIAAAKKIRDDKIAYKIASAEVSRDDKRIQDNKIAEEDNRTAKIIRDLDERIAVALADGKIRDDKKAETKRKRAEGNENRKRAEGNENKVRFYITKHNVYPYISVII